MAKYALNDIAPIQQGLVNPEKKCWLLNLDMVESNTGRIIDYVYVDPSGIGASTISFDTGNVLYSKLRPYLNKVVLPDRSGYATSEMLPLRPKQDVITREYLTLFLRSPRFVSYISEKTSGAKMPRANCSDLKEVEIECPPIVEQQRIAEIFNIVVSIIELRQRELEALDGLIKARFVEMFGDPVSNTFGWKKAALYEVTAKIGSGATPRGGKESYQAEGITLIRSMNVHDGRFEYKDLAHITNEQAKQLDYVTVQENDVFINITGASVARSCIVPSDVLPARVNQHVAIIRCDPSRLNAVFANNMFLNERFKGKLLDIGESGGATRQAITKQQLELLTVILPPLDRQKQFAVLVSQIDKSKFAIQKSLEETQKLFDSLMQKYFE